MENTVTEHPCNDAILTCQYYGVRIFHQLQYNIAAPVNDEDCEEEDEEDEDYPSKKKDDFDSDDPVERRCFSLL